MTQVQSQSYLLLPFIPEVKLLTDKKHLQDSLRHDHIFGTDWSQIHLLSTDVYLGLKNVFLRRHLVGKPKQFVSVHLQAYKKICQRVIEIKTKSLSPISVFWSIYSLHFVITQACVSSATSAFTLIGTSVGRHRHIQKNVSS